MKASSLCPVGVAVPGRQTQASLSVSLALLVGRTCASQVHARVSNARPRDISFSLLLMSCCHLPRLVDKSFAFSLSAHLSFHISLFKNMSAVVLEKQNPEHGFRWTDGLLLNLLLQRLFAVPSECWEIQLFFISSLFLF